MSKIFKKPALGTVQLDPNWDDVFEDMRDYLEGLGQEYLEDLDDPEGFVIDWFNDNYNPPTKKSAPAPDQNGVSPSYQRNRTTQRDPADRY